MNSTKSLDPDLDTLPILKLRFLIQVKLILNIPRLCTLRILSQKTWGIPLVQVKLIPNASTQACSSQTP